MKKEVKVETKQPKKEVAKIEECLPTSVEALIARAIDKGTPVETMEKILSMGREVRAEQAKLAFDESMAAFQGKCPVIKKTKGVPTKSGAIAYRYAPIEAIVDQVKELLQEYGFSYAIQTETGQGKVKAICIAKHKLGHSES